MGSKRKRSKKNKSPIKPARAGTSGTSTPQCDALLERFEREKQSDETNLVQYTLSKMAEFADPTAPTVTRIMDFPEDNMAEMFSKMICGNCNGVPTPFKRYICHAGHMLCEECGNDRLLKHQSKCLIEIRDEKVSLHDEEVQVLPLTRVQLTRSKCQQNLWMSTVNSSHFPLCQERLELYEKVDPVFAAFWMNAVWKCPFSAGGCNVVAKGRDLYDHVLECSARKTIKVKNRTVCAVDGCNTEVCMSDAIQHLIQKHDIYPMDLEDCDDYLWRRGGLIYVPLSAIQERRTYYTIIRTCFRFFLFCMEPLSTNSYDVGFWIRRISNKDNREEDEQPWFCYDLFLKNKFAALEMTYKSGCVTWRKPANEIFEDMDCLSIPRTMLLDQFVINCEENPDSSGWSDDEDSYHSIDSKQERGYLPVHFKLFVGNDVGQLYWKDLPLEATSSMESLVSISNESGEDSEESYRPDVEIESGFMTDESERGERESGSESSAPENETPGSGDDDRQSGNEESYPQSKFSFESNSGNESEESIAEESISEEDKLHSFIRQTDNDISEDEGKPEDETSRLTKAIPSESENLVMRNIRLRTEFFA